MFRGSGSLLERYPPSTFWKLFAFDHHLNMASWTRSTVPQEALSLLLGFLFIFTILLTLLMLYFVAPRLLRSWRLRTLLLVNVLSHYLACFGTLLIFAQSSLSCAQWCLQIMGLNFQLTEKVNNPHSHRLLVLTSSSAGTGGLCSQC